MYFQLKYIYRIILVIVILDKMVVNIENDDIHLFQHAVTIEMMAFIYSNAMTIHHKKGLNLDSGFL